MCPPQWIKEKTMAMPEAELQAHKLRWLDLAQAAADQVAAQSNIIESAQRQQADALVRFRTAMAELRELELAHQR
jgi:hypothetical protein